MKKIYLFAVMCLLNLNLMHSQCDIVNLAESPLEFRLSVDVPLLIWGQGFTAECDGFLDYVEFNAINPGTFLGGTLNVYTGGGVSGTPFYTEEFLSIVVEDVNGPVRINLTGNAQLSAGEDYTFQFDAAYEEFSTVELPLGLIGEQSDISGGGIYQIAPNSGDGNTVQVFLNANLMYNISITDQALSVGEVINNNRITFFPNPSSETIQISGLKTSENYTIFNVLGAEITTGTVSNQERIDVRNFANGLYLLKFDNGSALKFIKE